MATPNQTNPPGASQNIDPKQFAASLKNLLEDQGDYNNLLKNAIKELGQMDSAYGKIEARLATLNKDSINVKQVNRDLLTLKQKEYIEEKKLQDLQKIYSSTTQDVVKAAKDRAILDKEFYSAQGIAFNLEEEILYNLQQQGDLEAISLYAQEKKLQIAGKEVEAGKAILKNEKELTKSIGITGAVFKNFSEKLGVGDEFFEEMVLKARKLQEEGKKLSFGDKLGLLGKAAKGGISEALKDPLTLLPLLGTAFSAIGGAIGGIASGLKAAFDYIVEIQDKTVKFARAMNLSTGEARKMKMEFASLSISGGDLFVNSQKMVESQMEMVDALGVTNRLTNEQLATNIKLKDIAGLDLETRQAIVQSSTITGKSAEGITKSVLSQVAALKNATGISFQYQKILKEAANLGGYLGLSFAKYPEKLTKSLVTVKSMGLELKQLDSMANSFLDYESSISSEFEAQLLTGKNINLSKARELFLNNDLAAAAQEITKQVGTSEEFLQLNRISAESLAKSFGMSRDEMGNMLKQQELLSKLGATDLKDAQAKVQALKAQGKTKEEIIRLTGEEAYQNLTNASMQEKIGAFMEKIQQSISDFVEKSGVIEKLESFFEYLSKPENIRKVIEGVRDFFAGAVEFIGKAAYYILEGLDYVAFGQIPDDFIDSIKEGSANMGAQIRSLGGDLGGVTVSEKAAKGTIANSNNTIAEPERTLIGGGNKGAQYQVIQLVVAGKKLAEVNTQEMNSTFGSTDGQTGK